MKREVFCRKDLGNPTGCTTNHSMRGFAGSSALCRVRSLAPSLGGTRPTRQRLHDRNVRIVVVFRAWTGNRRRSFRVPASWRRGSSRCRPPHAPAGAVAPRCARAADHRVRQSTSKEKPRVCRLTAARRNCTTPSRRAIRSASANVGRCRGRAINRCGRAVAADRSPPAPLPPRITLDGIAADTMGGQDNSAPPC